MSTDDAFFPARPETRPMIYAYAENNPAYAGMLKVGFAARVVIAVRDKFGGDAPRVYKAAGVTAAAYSQIVSDETRRVSKRTAIRFAFALRLDPNGAALLLKSAGFAFSNSQTEDFVLQSCLETDPPIYDFGTVNLLSTITTGMAWPRVRKGY